MKNENMNAPTAIVTPAASKVKTDFVALVHNWERNPFDESTVYELATTVACSVLKKLSDPQRATAPARDSVSTTGCNPRIMALRRDVMADLAHVHNLITAANNAQWAYDWSDPVHPRPHLDTKGNPAPVVNPVETEQVAYLIDYVLSDGMDVVQEAVKALLEAYWDAVNRTHNCDPAPGWMEKPYEARKPRRTVLLPGDEVQYIPVTVTPVQMVYRAVRRYIQAQGGLQVAVNGYTYSPIDTTDTAAVDGVDNQLYRRYHKYADIGGYVRGTSPRLAGGPSGMGNAMAGLYTAGADDTDIVTAAARRMELTARQTEVLTRLYEGQTIDGIAAVLGVTRRAVQNVVTNIRARAVAAGLAPAGWTADTARGDSPAARAVVQCTPAGAVVATYPSIAAAARATSIDRGNIAAAARGGRGTAGGYVWHIKSAD